MTEKDFKRFRNESLKTYLITLFILFAGVFMSLKTEGQARYLFIGMSAVILLYGVISIARMKNKIEKANIESYHDALSNYEEFLDMKKEDFEKSRVKNLYDYTKMLYGLIKYYKILPNSFGLKAEVKTDIPNHTPLKIAGHMSMLFGINKSINVITNKNNKIAHIILYTDNEQIDIHPDKITVNDKDISEYADKLKSIKVLSND